MPEPVIALAMPLDRHLPAMAFAQWIALLRQEWWPGPFYYCSGLYIVNARNELTDKALRDVSEFGYHGPRWTNILFFDGDQVPPRAEPDGTTLYQRLCSVADRDVVVGLVHRRTLPFQPVAYEDAEDGRYRALSWPTMRRLLTERGIVEVAGAGTGAMLIRREVLEHLARDLDFPQHPLWRALDLEAMATEGERRMWTRGEDMLFSREVKERGYRIWLDTRWESGHVTEEMRFSRDYWMVEQQREKEFGRAASALIGPRQPRRVVLPN